jgi:feruloyl-CoA synthase
MSRTPAKMDSAHERPRLRPVKLGPAEVRVERRADGTVLMRSPRPLQPFPRALTERLAYWAQAARSRVFLAQRKRGHWRTLTYAEAYEKVRAIAAALLDRDLSPDRPIAILSGNDIEHALLGLRWCRRISRNSRASWML